MRIPSHFRTGSVSDRSSLKHTKPGRFSLASLLLAHRWRKVVAASASQIFSLGLAVLMLLTGLVLQAQAASGDLDTGFGSTGTVRTDFSGNLDQANAVAIQSDGKVIAAGSSFSSAKTVEDFIVARYNTNGSLDKRFGKNGTITTDFFRNVDSISAIAIQPDGNILVAGFAQLAGNGGNPRVFAIARYTPNGAADTSFGSGGSLTTSFGGSFAGASAILLQPDGKFIVAGTVDFNPAVAGSGLDFALARYNFNGSLDQTFGIGGKVVFDFFGSFDQANAALLQPDGKIVVAGSASYDSFNRNIGFALARFNANGSIDFGFGTGGKQITGFFGSGAQANGMVMQPDGKFVVAGTASDTATRPVATDFALARYNSDGSLDSTFGSGGQTAIPFSDSASEQANAVVLSPDGKIIVAGAAFRTFATPPDFAVARYNSDGTLDTGFGNGGAITSDFADGTDVAQALAIQSDGRVIAAGKAFRNNFDLALARYLNEATVPVDVTPPTTPSNLTARFNGSTSAIDLSWTGATDDIGIAGYRIFRDGGLALISTVNGTTFSDPNQSGTHSYTVAAIDAAGNQSNLSNVASATAPVADVIPPNAPAGLTATADSATSINLSWNAATDNVGVTGYQVFRDGTATPIGTTAGTTFGDIGVASGSTHSYTVAALDAAGNRSSFSNSASATTFLPPPDTTPPTTPTSLTAGVTAGNAINLAWNAATDNVGVTGYRIFRDNGSTAIATVNGTSFSDANQSGTHNYAVAAVDAAGNQSALSNTASATVTNATPVVLTSLSVGPTTVTAPANATGTITLSGAALGSGSVITLRSSDTDKATVPSTLTVPAGATTATFTIRTLTGKLGGGKNSVTITASFNGTSTTATLNILRP